jgi:hypothetical protein
MEGAVGAAYLNMLAGWTGMLMGVVSGAAVGLFFHREEWMGGYSSFRRRMLRLAHISFFGIGFLNILFALSVGPMAIGDSAARVASAGLLVGAVAMPANCLLAAWRSRFRHLFPVPVLAIAVAVVSVVSAMSIR